MTDAVRTVHGRSELEAGDGPLLVAVGVFDGLHRGHAYLIEHLVDVARARSSRPAVVTFDAHPDAVLVGKAPPLLMDAAERLERLAKMGVEVVVIEHFDDELRRTPYDVFVGGISSRTSLAGFVMTPDAAFGHERAGTPEALAALGREEGFDVIVVPPFSLDDRDVRSSDIRAAIISGDLARAECLLGRAYAVVGSADAAGRMTFPMPVVLPPAGTYEGLVEAAPTSVRVEDDGAVRLRDGHRPGRVRLEFRPDSNRG